MTASREKTLEEAALDYTRAKNALDNHQGRKDSDEFAALIAKWRAASFELASAAQRHAGAAA